jgi:HEPN domain-containing protein
MRDPRDEAERWLKQAEYDLRAAEHNFHIPTRYPNALPGGVPAEVYDEEDAIGAIALASKVLAMVRKGLPLDQEGANG